MYKEKNENSNASTNINSTEMQVIQFAAAQVRELGRFALSFYVLKLLGSVMGARLHEGYRQERKLMPDGIREPRIKQLTSKMDAKFANDVKSGVIPQTRFLHINTEGIVEQDIANTAFTELSPRWQDDNLNAGFSAMRTIYTHWEDIIGEKENVESLSTAVGNSIHEYWIGRNSAWLNEEYMALEEKAIDFKSLLAQSNIDIDRKVQIEIEMGAIGKRISELEELCGAYKDLSKREKDKDLLHAKMAQNFIGQVYELSKDCIENRFDIENSMEAN